MIKCKICGNLIKKSSYTNENLCSSECFSINFWNEKVDEFDSKNAIIAGELYLIGCENSNFKGFGGRKFCIKFDDGREITTTNLCHLGKIPESHRNKLIDNAIFVI